MKALEELSEGKSLFCLYLKTATVNIVKGLAQTETRNPIKQATNPRENTRISVGWNPKLKVWHGQVNMTG